GAALLRGNADVGVVDNKVFGVLETKPRHVGFTYNSDTPYGMIQLDLSNGPFVIELPPGSLIVLSMDVNQRWVADMGVPGPDTGKGGKHLIVPPDSRKRLPEDYYAWHSTSNRLIVGVRALPENGDVTAAIELIKSIKVHPLDPPSDWQEPTWINLTDTPQDTTPLRWEDNFKYWEVLNDVVQAEPVFQDYRDYYGELAALGMAKGKPFAPDARTKTILEKAANLGLAQMRAQSFADRRPDRVVWKDRKWEWVGLRSEDGDFNASSYVDLDAREVWFYQAIGASPAMFRRRAGSGSVYWLGLRDKNGDYLDGENAYKLSVPLPVPCKLFWSVTVYDAETRSQIKTDQENAALRSMFELKDATGKAVDLHFGPTAPTEHDHHWVKTIPAKGWFAYFRIYGPDEAAFDGSWKPGDFDKVE
ncbi:MAG TPA: DUF1254 domain-containing protein, partial [Gemmatimonadaceae bacterium]